MMNYPGLTPESFYKLTLREFTVLADALEEVRRHS